MTLRNTVLVFCLVQLALAGTLHKRDATAGLRQGCFPRPSAVGCRCAEKDKEGKEVTKLYETSAECAVKHDPQQIENKKTMLDELKTDVANLKDGCYPRPSNIGCRCTEKDSTGHDVAKVYETDAECRTDAEQLNRRRRETEERNAFDGHAHAKNEPVGGVIRPSGAVVSDSAVGDGETHRVRRGDANLSAEEAVEAPQGEIHEKAIAIDQPGKVIPDIIKTAAAGGAAETDEAERVPRHGNDGKPEHHEGDGHNHAKSEPVGAKVRPQGAAVSVETRRKRGNTEEEQPDHDNHDGHQHRLKRDASDAAAIPAGGADATAREASAGAASGGSLHPTNVPKPQDRPQVPAIQSEAEAKVMGEVAEHIEEAARRKREAVLQPRDRPATAGAGVHGAKQHGGLDQNVRDPVREKAAQNYQAVLNELKDKFRGLKEGCYPRPKGCLCVVGKDADGRDRTERRMKDADCKCQPGERGAGCPAQGA